MGQAELIISPLSDVTCAIKKYSGSDALVEIPSFIEKDGKNYTVVKIGEYAFAKQKTLQKVVLPDTVESIGDYAFSESSLAEIEIPASVKLIRRFAFDDCSQLTKVTLSEGLETLDMLAFSGSSSLKSITIPEGVKVIQKETFNKCTALEEVHLPSSVKRIEKDAFIQCNQLSKINLDKVSYIDEGAFISTPLEGTYRRYEILSEDTCAVAKYGELKTVEIPATVDIDDVTYKVVRIKRFALYSGNFEKVILPDTIEVIERQAFQECQELKEIVFPKGLKEIGDEAFRTCVNLESVEIPESVERIGDCAFSECENLAKVSISDNTQLGDNVFEECPKLEVEKEDEEVNEAEPVREEPKVNDSVPKAEKDASTDSAKSDDSSNLQLMDDVKQAFDLNDRERVFILLDIHKTYMKEGHGQPGENVILFREYEAAKAFIDENDLDRFDCAYPIGSMEKQDKLTNIKNMMMIASALGIKYAMLDGTSFFDIDWFLKSIGVIDKRSFNIRLTSSESKNFTDMLNKSGVPIRFNPVNVYNYSNPFVISESRSEELNKAIFSPEGTTQKEVIESLQKNTIHENCFSQMLIRSKYIPMAMQKNDVNMIDYFTKIQRMYASVIISQLESNGFMYVLCDKKTQKVFVRESPMGDKKNFFYVAYTDLFKGTGPCDYTQIKNLDELRDIIEQCQVDSLVVTDGPSVNAYIDLADVGLR
ncbi:MAG: leucine-rich repeat domain-containing protein [Paludibacteraceae bacterium]|nr:leucine-rich repeat domain-containing protein [Paludibacteraceae bacterium]